MQMVAFVVWSIILVLIPRRESAADSYPHTNQIKSIDKFCSRRTRMRGIIMQAFVQTVALSLQTDRSGRPVLTKGKRS